MKKNLSKETVDLELQMTNAYESIYPISKENHNKLRMCIPSGHVANMHSFKPYPLHITRANGAFVYSEEGHQLLDFLFGYSVFVHGHSDEDIIEAVSSQMKRGLFYGAPTSSQIEYCEALTSRIPSLDKLRICNSGTEATLFALRTARSFTKKSKIIKFFGGYHGTHDNVAASRIKNPASHGFSPRIIEDVLEIEFNDFEGLEALVKEHKNEIAAVIMEPFLGGAGTIAPHEGFLRFVRELTKRYGIILIFDEVISFRLDVGGAQQFYGIEADMLTLGKFIGGGFPIGVFGGRADIMDHYETEFSPPILHLGGTFFGHEAAMVAGKVCLEKLTTNVIKTLNKMGNRLAAGLREVIERQQLHIQVNQVGSMLAMHYTSNSVEDLQNALTSEKEVARLVHMGLLIKGIYSVPSGRYFFLSAKTTDDMTQEFIQKYEAVLKEIKPLIEYKYPHLVKSSSQYESK